MTYRHTMCRRAYGRQERDHRALAPVSEVLEWYVQNLHGRPPGACLSMDSLYYSPWFGILLSLCLRRFVFAPLSRVNLQLSWLTNTTGLGDYDELDLQSLRNHHQQTRAGAARQTGKSQRRQRSLDSRSGRGTYSRRECARVCVCARSCKS